MFTRWSLGRKLFVVFGLLLMCVGLASAVAWLSSAAMKGRQDETVQAAARLKLAEEVRAINAQIFGAEKNMILGGVTGDGELIEAWTTRLEKLVEQGISTSDTLAQSMQTDHDKEEAGRLKAAMGESNAALEDMVASMDAIRESSQKVSRIIKTIDQIAFQTNILALNAAVEAARAGEAGAGFAVVADEVRSLAHRSAQAARDTSDLIEESISRTEAGGQTVAHVAGAIGGISGTVGKVRTLIDGVSDASRQQAEGIEQVSDAVSRMGNVTQQTAATAVECAASSEELAAQAGTSLDVVAMLEAAVNGAGRTARATKAASSSSHAPSASVDLAA